MITHRLAGLTGKIIAAAELRLATSGSAEPDEFQLTFSDGSIYVIETRPKQPSFAHYGMANRDADIPAVAVPLDRTRWTGPGEDGGPRAEEQPQS